MVSTAPTTSCCLKARERKHTEEGCHTSVPFVLIARTKVLTARTKAIAL